MDIFNFQVKEKKYETVETTSKMLQSTMQILSQTSTINLRMASNNTIREGTTPDQPGPVTNSILFCWLFTLEDGCKKTAQ